MVSATSVGAQAVGRPGLVAPGSWFAALWAMAILFHLAANGRHLVAMDRIGLLQLVMVGAAAALLLRPSAWAAGLLAGLYLAVFWLKSPVVGNHEVILALLGLAILIAAVRLGASWQAAVAPAARWILIVAYGFIAFSKLNSGFFDPAGSCALLFADALGAGVGLGPPSGAIFDHGAIFATAVVETAIPVLLVRRRWRGYGVVLALGFHFLLAVDPVGHVWDFSATLLPLFLAFMPSPFHERLDAAVARIAGLASGSARALALGLLLAVQWLVMSGATPLPSWAVAYPLWLLLAAATATAAVRFLAERESGDLDRGWSIPRSLVPVVAITVAIGIGPYLEYRSAAAFNMYSNLQVLDGGTNHLLLGPLSSSRGDTPAAEGSEPSVVEIVGAAEDSPLQYYVGGDLLVPIENLDRYLTANPDEDPAVRWGGETVAARHLELGRAEPTEGLGRRLAAQLRHKFGFRRAVDRSSPGRCLRAWGPIG